MADVLGQGRFDSSPLLLYGCTIPWRQADTGLSGQTSHSARIATSVTRSPWQSAAMRSRTLQASSAGGSRLLRRAAPDAATEGRDVDDRVVPGVERDALGVAERQAIQESPGPARVPAQPEARLLAPFVDAEVDPIRPARVDGRAEAVVPLAGDPVPGPAAVGRLVQAALPVAGAGVRRAEVDDPAVARIHIEVLGPEQGVGPVDPLPGPAAVGRPVQAGALGDESAVLPQGGHQAEERPVAVEEESAGPDVDAGGAQAARRIGPGPAAVGRLEDPGLEGRGVERAAPPR